jgi:hypothetical protein
MTAKQSDTDTSKTDVVAKGTNPTQGINPQKGGQSGQKGSQMGGKTSPVGGAETFESDQTNQGQSGRINQGGAQTGRGDPYPPVNPERPKMAEGSSTSYGAVPSGSNLESEPSSLGAANAAAPNLEEEE